MDDQIEIIINNVAYTEIKEIDVGRDLDYLAGSFECAIANKFIVSSPVFIEDQVEIRIGDNPILLGNVDSLNSSITNSSHDYVFSGSDWTNDLVMTEISVNATYNYTKLKKLCEKVLSDNEINYITVVDSSVNDFVEQNGVLVRQENDFPVGSEQSAETGDTIFDFLSVYAEKAGKILPSDGDGRLIIYSNSGIAKNLQLSNTVSGDNEKIKSASYTQDFTNRYKNVIVVSQAIDLEDGGHDTRGIATDDKVRRNVNKIIINESVADALTAKKIAEFEVNKRRSDSVQYNCSVMGFYATKNVLWQPNLLVSIIDENFGIKATMLLKTVRYVYNETDGSICNLTFVSSDTYSLRTEASKFNEGVEWFLKSYRT